MVELVWSVKSEGPKPPQIMQRLVSNNRHAESVGVTLNYRAVLGLSGDCWHRALQTNATTKRYYQTQ